MTSGTSAWVWVIMGLVISTAVSSPFHWEEVLKDPPEAYDPAVWNHEAVFLGHTIRCAVPRYKPEFSPDIIAGALSWEGSGELRQAVRETWALTHEHHNREILVWFLMTVPMSEELIQEAERYNDMVFFDINEGYRLSLSPRSQLFFTVALDSFPDTKWFLKTDDDSFILMDLLFERLDEMKDPIHYSSFIGAIQWEGIPIREEGSTWFLSLDEYPHSVFPPYAFGPGYVLSNQLARCLSNESQSTESEFFVWEDVHTGMLLGECEEYEISDFNHPSMFQDYPIVGQDAGLIITHRAKTAGYFEDLWERGCTQVPMVNCTRRERTSASRFNPIPPCAETPETLTTHRELSDYVVFVALAFQLLLVSLLWVR